MQLSDFSSACIANLTAGAREAGRFFIKFAPNAVHSAMVSAACDCALSGSNTSVDGDRPLLLMLSLKALIQPGNGRKSRVSLYTA